MNALAELQRDFLAALRDDDRQLLPRLAEDRGLTKELGLGIYVNAYGARLGEALENDHALLGRYLGDALWEQLCSSYITAHPSRCRSLRHFGNSLPEYLRRADPFAAQPQIAELANFERLLLDTFDAADAPRADWSQLQALPDDAWPSLCLSFHPSLQRYSSAWNSVDIWQALKSEQAPPGPARDPGEWVLWRDGERITHFRSLDTEESTLLDYAIGGGDFAGLCERLAQWHNPQVVPARALHYLRRWLEDGWVAR